MWRLQAEANACRAQPTPLVGVSYIYMVTLISWELIYFLSCRHDILNPGEHDILFHPDAIHALMPCVLPETD